MGIFEGESIEKGVKELALLMNQSANTVVLTGAGMDTESNIPDFRGKDGLWRELDPRQVASIGSFYENYELFHEFYTDRIRLLENIKPHEGHYILADFEKRGIIKSIATQNVSGLHHMAGNKKVYELHGNIRQVRCNECNNTAKLRDFLDKKVAITAKTYCGQV